MFSIINEHWLCWQIIENIYLIMFLFYKISHYSFFISFFFIDSYEPSFNPIPLHFHYSHIKQGTRMCNCPTCQTSFGWPGWFRAGFQDWSRGPASNRGKIYQFVTTLLRTGKVGKWDDIYCHFLVGPLAAWNMQAF